MMFLSYSQFQLQKRSQIDGVRSRTSAKLNGGYSTLKFWDVIKSIWRIRSIALNAIALWQMNHCSASIAKVKISAKLDAEYSTLKFWDVMESMWRISSIRLSVIALWQMNDQLCKYCQSQKSHLCIAVAQSDNWYSNTRWNKALTLLA